MKTGSGEALELTGEDLAELKEMAGLTTLAQIVKTVKLFGQVEIDASSSSPLPLELALVDSLLVTEGKKEAAPAEEKPAKKAATKAEAKPEAKKAPAKKAAAKK